MLVLSSIKPISLIISYIQRCQPFPYLQYFFILFFIQKYCRFHENTEFTKIFFLHNYRKGELLFFPQKIFFSSLKILHFFLTRLASLYNVHIPSKTNYSLLFVLTCRLEQMWSISVRQKQQSTRNHSCLF